jgi:hypothetical protein
MRRTMMCGTIAALVSLVASRTVSGQSVKSHSSGFFVGLGVEGAGIVTNVNGGSTNESGGGAGLELGYGFSPRWSLVGDASGATINAEGGGTYTLSHVDLGARVHFRTGPNVVVPFIQFGLAGRDERQDVATLSGTHTVSADGGGIFFGVGMNAHFNPGWAFSGNVNWVVGNFTDAQVDNQSVGTGSVSATSARIHLGLVWFPGA